MLKALVADRRHVYLDAAPQRLSLLLDLLRRCHGHNQVNDAYLIWLAMTRDAVVLTFDAPLRHLAPATQLVEVLV